jgi:hypothetical protein
MADANHGGRRQRRRIQPRSASPKRAGPSSGRRSRLPVATLVSPFAQHSRLTGSKRASPNLAVPDRHRRAARSHLRSGPGPGGRPAASAAAAQGSRRTAGKGRACGPCSSRRWSRWASSISRTHPARRLPLPASHDGQLKSCSVFRRTLWLLSRLAGGEGTGRGGAGAGPGRSRQRCAN